MTGVYLMRRGGNRQFIKDDDLDIARQMIRI